MNGIVTGNALRKWINVFSEYLEKGVWWLKSETSPKITFIYPRIERIMRQCYFLLSFKIRQNKAKINKSFQYCMDNVKTSKCGFKGQ